MLVPCVPNSAFTKDYGRQQLCGYYAAQHPRHPKFPCSGNDPCTSSQAGGGGVYSHLSVV